MTRAKTFTDYVRRSYRKDLKLFVSAYRGRGHDNGGVCLGHPDSHLDFGPDKVFVICDANKEKITEAMASGLDDARRFSVVLSLEAALFAGVHQYDSANFARYVKALPLTVHVEAHGLGGVLRPHILLAGIETWGPRSVTPIVHACEELLPTWSTEYDRQFRRSAGAKILRALSEDQDMKTNPYGVLPVAVMAALGSGLRAAADAAEEG